MITRIDRLGAQEKHSDTESVKYTKYKDDLKKANQDDLKKANLEKRSNKSEDDGLKFLPDNAESEQQFWDAIEQEAQVNLSQYVENLQRSSIGTAQDSPKSSLSHGPNCGTSPDKLLCRWKLNE